MSQHEEYARRIANDIARAFEVFNHTPPTIAQQVRAALDFGKAHGLEPFQYEGHEWYCVSLSLGNVRELMAHPNGLILTPMAGLPEFPGHDGGSYLIRDAKAALMMEAQLLK